jgi:glycosyltransferase involved in cell wall biosynthesis
MKGSDILMKGLDRLQAELDFTITIVGNGRPEFLTSLKSKTSSALWNRITLRNNLNSAEVADEISAATMMLFPTRADTSPNSVKEAVVAGLPVVASQVGGIPDYVVNGMNGLLFQANDLSSFVSAVRLAARHPLLRSGEVDPKTHQQMRDYLSPSIMRKRFLAAYQAALNAC